MNNVKNQNNGNMLFIHLLGKSESLITNLLATNNLDITLMLYLGAIVLWIQINYVTNAKRMKFRSTMSMETAVYHAGMRWQILWDLEMNNNIIDDDDDKQIRYCRYCKNRLRPIDYSFFEFGFDFDGKKYCGCRNCSFKYLGIHFSHKEIRYALLFSQESINVNHCHSSKWRQ